MPLVKVKEHESIEAAVRRFKRMCEKTGVISDMRRREYYEKPTSERKRLVAQAKKRWQKKLSRGALAPVRGGGAQAKKRKVRRERADTSTSE
jgi:small subunit ribosomal protein S21